VPNPYRYGSPVSDAHFTDRERESQLLVTSMLNGQKVVLLSPRRWGKSSLLNRALSEVRAAGGATGKVSFIKCSNAQEVAETLVSGVVNGPLGWLQGRGEDLRRALARFRLGPELRLSPTGEFSVRLLPGSVEADWHSVVTDAARLLRDVADRDRPVSLVMDEFQRVYEIEPGLAGVFKDLTDELAGVSLIFAGSKRHLMEEMTLDASSAALYRVGRRVYLDKIERTHFIGYLRERARAGGKHLHDEAGGRIYDHANGIPNDVQLVAFWSFENAEAEIDEAAVAAAVADAVGDQSVEFKRLFDGLAPSQQRLLKAIAEQSPKALTSGWMISHLQVASPRSITEARRVLEEADLIERRDGVWSVQSGLLREWLTGSYD